MCVCSTTLDANPRCGFFAACSSTPAQSKLLTGNQGFVLFHTCAVLWFDASGRRQLHQLHAWVTTQQTQVHLVVLSSSAALFTRRCCHTHPTTPTQTHTHLRYERHGAAQLAQCQRLGVDPINGDQPRLDLSQPEQRANQARLACSSTVRRRSSKPAWNMSDTHSISSSRRPGFPLPTKSTNLHIQCDCLPACACEVASSTIAASCWCAASGNHCNVLVHCQRCASRSDSKPSPARCASPLRCDALPAQHHPLKPYANVYRVSPAPVRPTTPTFHPGSTLKLKPRSTSHAPQQDARMNMTMK